MFILSLLLSFVPTNAETLYSSLTTSLGETRNCYSDTYENRSWKYCITETNGSKSADVLYDFHGLGGSENDWLDKERNIQIRNYWKNHSLNAPVVASLSFGPVWILAEKNPSSFSGLYELFTQHIIDQIETKLKSYTGRRLLIGASMGGFNASQIFLKNPGLFDKYVMSCPIIANISLYASNAEILAYQQENHANWLKVRTMFGIGRQYFPDTTSWNTAWAIKLAEKNLNENFPPIHMSCGTADEYGIYKSVVEFKNLAVERGVNVTWESISGGAHCSTSPTTIAKFLIE